MYEEYLESFSSLEDIFLHRTSELSIIYRRLLRGLLFIEPLKAMDGLLQMFLQA